MSTADELIKYKQLLDDGAITEEEYNDLKTKLLNKEQGIKTPEQIEKRNKLNKKIKALIIIGIILASIPILICLIIVLMQL